MIPIASNSSTLLSLVTNEGLFTDLLNQLQKDFELSGLSFEYTNSITTPTLIEKLQKKIARLVQTNFDAYLQLLYRIDIPEKMMHSDEMQDSVELAKKSTFVILQREWEKVYFRKKFS